LTRRLYRDDPYRTEFEAVVVAVEHHGPHDAIELDQTLFYPESGGQPSDAGEIGGLAVENVIEEGDRILHMTSGDVALGPGDRVRGSIDWRRRFINMQQHTGQHVLSQAFFHVLDATTVSSRLGLEHSTIDVSGKELTWNDVKAVEDLANKVVYENRPVVIYEARMDEVEGLRVKIPMDRDVIRVVEVEDFDRSPCGGTHTRTTGEIGPVKILRWERVRDETRVEFVCGMLAMDDYFWKNRFVVDLAADLTTKDANLPERIPELIRERKDLAKEVAALKRGLARYRAEELLAAARRIGEVRVVSAYLPDAGPQELKDMAAALTGKGGGAVLLASGRERLHLVFSRSSDVAADMRAVIKGACEIVGGKGGGRPEVCQGGGTIPGKADEALEAAVRILEALLERSG
jgi:alanyl-tRNA synthetase